jgi:hypothetical protein
MRPLQGFGNADLPNIEGERSILGFAGPCSLATKERPTASCIRRDEREQAELQVELASS